MDKKRVGLADSSHIRNNRESFLVETPTPTTPTNSKSSKSKGVLNIGTFASMLIFGMLYIDEEASIVTFILTLIYSGRKSIFKNLS